MNQTAQVPIPRSIKVEACAQAAHEMNRLWSFAHGDASHKPWSEAPDWQKQSAIKGVEGVLSGNSPVAQHEAWCEDKVKNGWVYGPVKDPERKTHPCLVPYQDLPKVQKDKDYLFSQTVKTLAVALNLE
jgi:hypothetical protein